MDHIAHLRRHFEEGIELRRRMAETMPAEIARAGEALAQALKSGRKVLACGNGGSAADSQHFAAEIVGRFERERPGMPAIALTVDTSALTAIANDYDWDRVFSKQVEALGQPGDVLLALSTSGNSANVMAAIEAAHEREMTVVALTGRGGGRIGNLLRETDVHICVPHERTARIQEVHILVLHCICDGVDAQLLGEQDHPT